MCCVAGAIVRRATASTHTWDVAYNSSPAMVRAGLVAASVRFNLQYHALSLCSIMQHSACTLRGHTQPTILGKPA